MKKIVIIPNDSKDINLETTKKLINTIGDKAQIYLESKYCDYGFNADFVAENELYDNADIVIVIGGDGTILHVAEPCSKRGIPVLGINLGKVGFMTEVNISDIESSVSKILNDDFKIEKRMMMEISVLKKDGTKNCYHSLNDVVVSKSASPMISIEVHSLGEKINQYYADGLIISTPTGSTGYSLSAGGPVADPTMELFIASPICAHMLHARPALMTSEKPICVSISDELGKEALVTVDGEVKETIQVGDEVIINKSLNYCSIIKLGKQSFYDVLTEKLK